MTLLRLLAGAVTLLLLKSALFSGLYVLHHGTADAILSGPEVLNKDVYLGAASPQLSRHLLGVETKNETANCTAPAVDSFPHLLFDLHDLRHGWVCVHCLVALYSFFVIGFICAVYLVPAVELICRDLQIPTDVAGATLLAAASSAPELCVSIIGTFVAENDAGSGAIVGSAAFNIFVVLALCSFGVQSDMDTTIYWYPVVRDSASYAVCIFMLVVFSLDGEIMWYESLIMAMFYIVYILLAYHNTAISHWVDAHCSSCCLTRKADYEAELTQLIPRDVDTETGNTSETYGTPNGEANGQVTHNVQEKKQRNHSVHQLSFEGPDGPPPPVLSPPKSTWKRILWALGLPAIIPMFLTVPDCRRTSGSAELNWITLIMSSLWLAFWTYILYWMISVIGFTSGVRDTVLGYTVLAAGTTVPDAIASLIVIRDGYPDMAIGNIFGSNVFEVCLCLGLVWLMKSIFSYPLLKSVEMNSNDLPLTSIFLVASIVFVLISLPLNGWKLNKKVGTISGLMYVVFAVGCILLGEGYFGNINEGVTFCPAHFVPSMK